MLGLGAEVERDPLRIAVSPAITISSRGAGDSVDSHLADQLALGLLDVAVPGAGDHVDRRDRFGAQRQRGDRLGPAHRVDLVGAADRRRGQDHVGTALRPFRCGVASDDPPDAGGLRRDAAHEGGRGIGRRSARA